MAGCSFPTFSQLSLEVRGQHLEDKDPDLLRMENKPAATFRLNLLAVYLFFTLSVSASRANRISGFVDRN